jgi:hypothetical protein
VFLLVIHGFVPASALHVWGGLQISFVLLTGPPHQHQAYCSNDCPEYGTRTPAQSQGQPRGGGYAEKFRDQHISAFVGPDISWIQGAGSINELGETFERERRNHGDSRTHELQNDVDFQDCQRMDCKIQRQACPKCVWRFAMKSEQTFFC